MTAASFPPKVQRPFSFLASPDAGWKSFPAIPFPAPPYSLRSSFPAKTARTNAKENFPNGLSDFPAHEDPRPLGLFQLSALAAGQDLQLSDPKNTPEKGSRLRYFPEAAPFLQTKTHAAAKQNAAWERR